MTSQFRLIMHKKSVMASKNYWGQYSIYKNFTISLWNNMCQCLKAMHSCLTFVYLLIISTNFVSFCLIWSHNLPSPDLYQFLHHYSSHIVEEEKISEVWLYGRELPRSHKPYPLSPYILSNIFHKKQLCYIFALSAKNLIFINACMGDNK